MKIFLCTVFLSLLVFGCSSKTKTQPDGLTVGYEEFQKILQPRSSVLLEGQDAMLVILAMPGDAYPSLYRYDIKTKKLTKEYDHGQTISDMGQDRTGKRIYVLIDNKGDENFGVYTYDPAAKKLAPYFVKPGFRSFVANSDQDGKTLFLISNFENKAVYSVYKMDVASGKIDRLTDGKMNVSNALVSPSGAKLVLYRALSNNENKLYSLDVKTKKVSLLYGKKGAVFSPTYFTADEKAIIGSSDYGQDRDGCARIDLKAPNQVKYILKDKEKDILCAYGEWSKLFIVEESARGKSTLKLYKKQFSDEVAVPVIFNNQSVHVTDYDRTNGDIYFRYSAANSPGTIYRLRNQTPEKVLDYNISSIPSSDMATSYDFDYKSFDGKNIHGIITAKPEWLNSGKKYPVIVWPHGGPDGAESHDYRSVFQFLALNGYVVVAPNFRGSSGYGKHFETLNDKDWGGGHIKDVIAAKNEALKLPYVDAKNAYILGGSFGGYSVLSAITTHPTDFKAAVGIVAIGNLFTFMKSIPPDEAWQSEFRREMGDPVKDKKLYEERSPFFHVDKIAIPVQIYQAENDIRTVKAEMDTFVDEMKKRNKPVEYTVLKDVGHGLETPESRRLVYEGAVRFFNSMNQ